MTSQKRRLSRADWTEAGLHALAEGGIAAVAIEPIAAALGTTKGSAYWHFPNRSAFLTETLLRWESEHTEAVIEQVSREPDPLARLRRLLTLVLDRPVVFAIELSLVGHADDEVAGPVLRRVTERRLGYLTEQLTQLGLPKSKARRRALLAYGTYLGHAQIGRSAPAALPRTAAARRAHVDEAIATLTARP